MTEEEMLKDLAAADAAGQPELARRIADTIRTQRDSQPGLARRALNWATTPTKTSEEAQRISDQMDPAPINRILGYSNKDEPDWLAGAKAFVRGMPGHIPYGDSREQEQRAGRFNKEHPVLGTALPIAGGMMGPSMIPVSEAAYFPVEAAKKGFPAAAQTLTSTGKMSNNLQAQMRAGATALEDLPKVGMDIGKTSLGGAIGGSVLPKVGGPQGVLLALALKAARKYGPGMGASALRGGAGALDALPTQALPGALQTLRAVLESQRQNRSEQE